MTDIHFSFGPDSSYAFVASKSWKFKNVPIKLERIFNSDVEPKDRVERPYWVALGPRGSYFMVGLDCVAGNHYWLSKSRFLEDVRKTFRNRILFTGPRMSFGLGTKFVFCSPLEKNFIANEITPELRGLLEESTTVEVALGHGDSYVALFSNGGMSWNCADLYPEVDHCLRQAKPYEITHVALNPYSPGQYFIVYMDRRVKYSMSASCAFEIEPLIEKWQLEAFETVVSASLSPSPAISAISRERADEGKVKYANLEPPPYENHDLKIGQDDRRRGSDPTRSRKGTITQRFSFLNLFKLFG